MIYLKILPLLTALSYGVNSDFLYDYSEKQIADYACLHSLEGSSFASRFLSDYFYELGDDYSGDFFFLVSAFQKDPKSIRELEETKLKFNYNSLKHAEKCALNLKSCFYKAIQDEKLERERFFKEYFNRVPLGWPNYHMAVASYLESKKLVCKLDLKILSSI